MKKVFAIIICIISATCAFAQFNRQDAIYVKTKRIDASYTGKFARLDFAKNAGNNGTIVFVIDNNPVEFTNKQADNQASDFYGQYLESTNNKSGYTIRLTNSRIDAVTTDSIEVTNYFDFYGKGNVLAAGKSIQQQYWLSKKAINRVVVKEGKKGI